VGLGQKLVLGATCSPGGARRNPSWGEPLGDPREPRAPQGDGDEPSHPTEHHPAVGTASDRSAVAGTAFLIPVLRRSMGAGRALSLGADGWPQARGLGSAVGSPVPVSEIQDIFKDSGRKT